MSKNQTPIFLKFEPFFFLGLVNLNFCSFQSRNRDLLFGLYDDDDGVCWRIGSIRGGEQRRSNSMHHAFSPLLRHLACSVGSS